MRIVAKVTAANMGVAGSFCRPLHKVDGIKGSSCRLAMKIFWSLLFLVPRTHRCFDPFTNV
jgi:hypothetical protein